MPAAKKLEMVAELADLLARSRTVVAAEYRGLSVADTTALRRQLREAGLAMEVVKNTLFRLAATRAGKAELGELAEGPTALIIGFDDPLVPIKAVSEYQRTARNTFAARKAFFEGQMVAGAAIAELASLPPKEIMLSELIGALASPMVNLVSLLQATVQEFAGLIDSRAAQVEAAG
jgi:large subunit ribosomal protein L10